MKQLVCAAMIAGAAVLPGQARADALGATVAGGFIGGIAGSVYSAGATATAASIGSTVAGAASIVPAAATGAAAAVAATSTPILVGVVGGGAIGYFLYNLVR